MKKTVICNIPMKERVDLSIYTSDDQSLPVSNKAVRYPINAFLAETMEQEDEVKVILLVKKDRYGHYEKNTVDFCAELNSVYDQASFVDGQAVDTKICDMVPLYCLSSITNTVRCSTSDQARSIR